MKKILTMMILFSMFTAAQVNAAAIINVTSYAQQEQGNWCWDATSMAVMKYYHTPMSYMTQCQFASRDNSAPWNYCCTGGRATAGLCNRYGSLPTAVEDQNVVGGSESAAASIAKIDTQTDQGRPMIMWVGWDGGGAHFVSLYGLEKRVTAGVTENYLYIHDSGDNTRRIMKYSEAKRYRGNGTWGWTMYTNGNHQ